MKKQILLFISLVLLAVQGWATPVDTLDIHTSSNLSQGFQKFDGLNKSTFLDQTKGSVLSDGLPFLDPILAWLTQCMKVKIFIDKSNMVIPVTTVGETTTATFDVWGQYTTLYDIDEIPIKIEKNPEGVFSVNPPSVISAAIDKENLGGKVTVTVSFTPQHAGTYQGKIRIKLPFPFINGHEWMDFEAVAVNPPSPTINVTKSTLNFGSVHNGAEKSESFNVSGNALTGDLSLMCNNPNFRVEPAYISADDAAKGVEVTVTYSPKESGIHNETLTICGGGATEVPVTLVGQCDLPVIECDVSAMYFGQHFLGDDYTKYFTVNGSYLTEDLHISSSDPSFIVSPPTVSRFDYNHSVAVTYKPTTYGDHDAIITISSSGVSYPINVSGSCIARPSISVDKTSLNFGTVKLGDDPLTQTITVTGTNLTGDLNLSITGSMFTAQPYRISPSDAAAGRPVVVTYKPTAAGNHTATLVITGGGGDTTKINLSGKCVKPTITVNTTSLDFGTIEVGQEKPLSINVTGSNLTGSITVIKEETHGGQFTISRETLNASGGSVIVTFKPTEAGSFGGCVRFSSEGATPVSVSLTGKAQELSVYPTTLNFGTTYKNGTVTKKITVHGGNLTGNVTLSSSNAK
ncbi:MAG: choice-of-anchor D domain-containing protein, partial [Muribaculaceae bacterium]|nr:choice-of-anchor D domain-containing protein [Muribaculaceae bacterium]